MCEDVFGVSPELFCCGLGFVGGFVFFVSV